MEDREQGETSVTKEWIWAH